MAIASHARAELRETNDVRTRKASPAGAVGGIQSAEIGIRVLSTLADGIGPMTLKSVAAGAGLTPSNARRYLVSLMRAGMVEQDPATGNYDLGPLALRVGLAAIYRLNVVRAATPFLSGLRDAIGETVMLAIWSDHGPIVVHWEESLPPVIINLRIGSVLPLLSSASGHVFLAWLPRAQTNGLVKKEQRRLGGPGRVDVAALVEETRKHNLGRFGTADAVRSISSIAAPVFDHQRKLAAVVATFGPGESFDNTVDGDIASKLAATTRQISFKMGLDER